MNTISGIQHYLTPYFPELFEKRKSESSSNTAVATLPTGEQSLLLLQLPFAYQKCLDLGDGKGSAILGLHGSENRVPAKPASPALNSYPYLASSPPQTGNTRTAHWLKEVTAGSS